MPEPIETTKTSSRASPPASARPRRFKPEIIETDFRSVKGKLNGSPPRRHARSRVDHLDALPEASGAAARLSPNRAVSDPMESKFSYASLLRQQQQQQQSRRHSFRVPELPSIASNSSEESDAASESRSLSPTPEKRVNQTAQEGGEGEFSEYLLSLAAHSAQQQLKDQALAAFPNEQVYQHFDHFAIDDEGRDSEEDGWMYPPKHHLKSRRQSSADLTWELEYLRQHKEEAEQRFRVMATRKPDLRLPLPKATDRLGPSPPMLGADIVLPQSTSPVGTFSDNHGIDTGAETDPCTGCGGLWCGPARPDDGRGTGLWMGTCRKGEDDERGSQIMSGIMTPMARDDGPGLGPNLSPGARVDAIKHDTRPIPRSIPSHSPSTSPNPNPNPSKALEDEFHDGFVTQIYNYLSLGYPCVARNYDHELSKISGIHIEAIRQDDLKTDAKGYVMAPENDMAVACTRWRALRLYIQEWARQQPSMTDEKRWGVPERRGSWAF